MYGTNIASVAQIVTENQGLSILRRPQEFELSRTTLLCILHSELKGLKDFVNIGTYVNFANWVLEMQEEDPEVERPSFLSNESLFFWRLSE